jgi:hypothetical protein
MDAGVHAIVADGHLGKDGSIQNWPCQACGGARQRPLRHVAVSAEEAGEDDHADADERESGTRDTGDGVVAGGEQGHGAGVVWRLRLGERAPVLWNEIVQARAKDNIPPMPEWRRP